MEKVNNGNSKANKLYLITGANGFVGQALCKRMISNGWRVRGTVRNRPLAFSRVVGAEAIEIPSIDSKTDWSKALVGVDTVVHLAARTHVMIEDSHDPLEAYRLINVAGTERLARSAGTFGVERFIYLSSVKVNGEGRAERYTELDIPAPEDPYGISKWEAEQVLYDIAGRTGLEVVALRPPLVYGPGVKANFLRLLDLIYRGIPLPLASVDNRRSLIYLENLVDAIVTCINNPKATGQTYFVSDGDDASTPELIRRVATVLGRPARLFPFPPALMHVAGKILGKSAAMERLLGSLTVDPGKIRRELQWEAPYTMVQGLQETADWYLKGRPSVA
jgi:nucleoside-diphosphate-sugar epimerase